mmetsp:Transcript_18958/g.32410  ORF Transcript_18958/g.32410 Transcript_18958/m.32410 type:complete len:568 (+) Transcript_18958:106-1809(+)
MNAGEQIFAQEKQRRDEEKARLDGKEDRLDKEKARLDKEKDRLDKLLPDDPGLATDMTFLILDKQALIVDKQVLATQWQTLERATVAAAQVTATAAAGRVTASQLMHLVFQRMPLRDTPRKTSSKTFGVNARTFGKLIVWELEQDLLDLDQMVKQLPGLFDAPTTGITAAASQESDVQGPFLDRMLHWSVNKIAKALNFPAEYKSGGNQRGVSRTDLVMAMSKQQGKVIACIEVKGDWQFKLAPGESLIEVFQDTARFQTVQPALQQLWGDMVLEEVPVGILTNYNSTVLVARLPDSKSRDLMVSRTFTCDSKDSPVLLTLLYALQIACKRADESFPLADVPQSVTNVIADGSSGGGSEKAPDDDTSAKESRGGGSHSQMSGGTSSKEKSNSTNRQLKIWSLGSLSLGMVLGSGSSGLTRLGSVEGQAAAVKIFACEKTGHQELHEELDVYAACSQLQGSSIPRVLAFGLLDHTFQPFLALSFQGTPLSSQGTLAPSTKAAAAHALRQLHAHGVAHGDVRLDNLLVGSSTDAVVVIDFVRSSMCARPEVLKLEEEEFQGLLAARYSA